MIEWFTLNARAPVASYISASIVSSGEQKQLILRFSKAAQSDMRLIKGDRLLIGFDEVTKQICFKRTTENNGHKLTGGKKDGTVLHIQVTVKNKELVKSTHFDKTNVIDESAHFSINAPMFFNKKQAA